VSDSTLGFISHPPRVIANVLSQAPSTGPGVHFELNFLGRMDRRATRVPRWDLDERLCYYGSHWIQVARFDREAKALSFKRDRPSAAERIKDRWNVVATGVNDLASSYLEDCVVRCVLPLDEIFDYVKEPVPLHLLFLIRPEPLRVGRWIINERSEEDRTTRSERSPSPPEVKSGGVALADGLLPSRLSVDRVEWQCNFDEFLLVGHAGASARSK
jgi:hypothetical protein